MINTVLKCISAWIRRQMIGVWVAGSGIQERKGALKENNALFLKNPAFHSLKAFFAEKSVGTTVFWTPERAGKTYTLAKMEIKSTVDHRIAYVDFCGTEDAKKVLYKQIGLDPENDTKPLSHYLLSGVFFTFIFDHFDKAIDPTWISTLSEDSVGSAAYNVLVLVNDRFSAHSILTSCGQLMQREHTRLLGPQYCGRWSADELGEFKDERYNELVNMSGSLAPMISIRNRYCQPTDPLMLLRVAKLQAEWEQGEMLLGQFRLCDFS